MLEEKEEEEEWGMFTREGVCEKWRKAETREEVSRQLCDTGKRGDVAEVKRLLEHPLADPNFVWGRALSEAAAAGMVDVVKLLLTRVNPFADDGIALRRAAFNGHSEVVRLLLQDGRADPGSRNNAAMLVAAGYGYSDVVKLLLHDVRVDPASHMAASLRWAAWKGHTQVLELLLADGRADPAACDDEALRVAAQKGHLEAVKLLLADPRTDASAESNYAVCWAARNGFAEIVRLLLQDARVDATLAISDAHPRVVPLLLEDEKCGFHVNQILFEWNHPWAVERYNQLPKEREDRIRATLWCMKEIGDGWGDLQYPTGERMLLGALFWGEVVKN